MSRLRSTSPQKPPKSAKSKAESANTLALSPEQPPQEIMQPRSAPKKVRTRSKSIATGGTLEAQTTKKTGAEKKQAKPKLIKPVKVVEESEKIPFSEVGTENSIVVPPPMAKPVTPVVKVRNRSPLPMPVPPLPESGISADADE